ncbi:MAG: alcohol dehydrogenase catalytic domain-containing protein, partial [Solirubrobacterales bacterium]
MKAVVCKQAELSVVERDDVRPGRGQLLLDVLRCGICGSDLHARHHCDELADVIEETGYEHLMRSDQEVVFGHEFCGEILEHGPGCRKSSEPGSHVVAFPLRRNQGGVHGIGLSELAPGAYAERVVVEESLAVEVPNGLPPAVSALTEPLAVGLHAVRRGEVGKRDVAIVIGCGPVGLAVIAMLKAEGVRQIIASDLSSGRRELARRLGADLVVDPAET